MGGEEDKDLELHNGFDAGNYANAYETTEYEIAIERARKVTNSEDYLAAFTIGFFSSYERWEMDAYQEEYERALASKAGQRCLQLGFIDDE